MDTEDQEALIREVAGKHGVMLGKDDPIMILRTLNARILQDAAEQQQAGLEAFKSEMEGVAARWNVEAKGKAERILNAALEAGKQAMAAELQGGGEVFRRQIAAGLEGLAEQMRQTRQAAMLNLGAAVLTCVAAGLALWAAIK